MQTNDGILYLIYSCSNSVGDKSQSYNLHCVDSKDMFHVHMGYKVKDVTFTELD